MQLGTFGAIISFALELEQQAASFYEGQGRDKQAKNARKRIKRLERARRESVSEMILESITGLDSDNYQPDLSGDQPARALAENARRFYTDAAAKLPIKEVARLFRRLADDHAKQL